MPRPMYGPTRHRSCYRNGPAELYDVPASNDNADADADDNMEPEKRLAETAKSDTKAEPNEDQKQGAGE